MRSIGIKLTVSAVIALMIVASMPFIGLTESSRDSKEGLVLDFGYWNIEWIDMSFTPGMDGFGALEEACHIKGYSVTRLEDGTVYAVNDQENLVGIKWTMYVMDGSKWRVADPASVKASDYRLISWARSGGVESLVPATDSSGFGYYSYAEDGVSLITGRGMRVVTLAPSITETVVAIGGLGCIIGTDLYSNYPQAIVDGHNDGSIAITGGYTDPNYEWIVKLAPDLVLCDGSVGQQVTLADKLRKSGIDCVVLYDAVDIGAMYDNLWIAASALGMSANANKAIAELRSTISVVSGIAGDTNTRVFAALSADPSPWTAGSNTFMSDLIASAGGRNVFDSQSSSWFMVSKEQIYAKQPQVIIIISTKEITGEEEYQGILDSLDPVWKSTPAYQNGEVYVFSGTAGDVLSRPGPRLAEAEELLCKILNPEAFEQRDPLDTVPKYFGNDYHYYLKYQKEVIR
jgi:iron complex transport system substrate-binding protein